MKFDPVAEAYIKRSLQLLRAAEGDALEMAAILDSINLKIIEIIKKQYPIAYKKENIDSIIKEVKSNLSNFYLDILPVHFAQMGADIIKKELQWNQETIVRFMGDDARKLTRPKFQEVVETLNTQKYQGKTWDDWIDRTFDANSKKIAKQLGQSFSNSESISEVVSKVKQFTNGSTSDVKAITRSYFMHGASEAKESVFALNTDLTEGRIWSSTLDSRTTPLICGVRDQHEYDNDLNAVGHSLPWGEGPGKIHFCCRSTWYPKLKGFNQTTQRPMIGAGENYERGDNLTNRGTVRKPNKDAREKGIFEISQTTTETNYEKFLKEQSKHNIDYVADILGNKQDAIDFRDGKTTLQRLAKESPVTNPIKRSKL